jgi:predicted flap endonuclease-1-like 5' DNA nuclease
MGLISAIKSLLGLDNSRGRSREDSGGTDVTVEREPDAESERAVKESDATETDAAEGEADSHEPKGTDAAEGERADTEDEADSHEPEGTDADEEAELTFENDRETAGEEEVETMGEERVETTTEEGEDDETADGETADDETADGEPVENIKGIGPAYAERLGGVGVHTVSDLADADAADLNGETGIGEKRLQTWIDRANAR